MIRAKLQLKKSVGVSAGFRVIWLSYDRQHAIDSTRLRDGVCRLGRTGVTLLCPPSPELNDFLKQEFLKKEVASDG